MSDEQFEKLMYEFRNINRSLLEMSYALQNIDTKIEIICKEKLKNYDIEMVKKTIKDAQKPKRVL